MALAHLLVLVTPPRVGIVVNSGVSGKLVRAGEALGAAMKLAGVRLLAGMRADVPGLVLEAVEGLVAQRALVGPGQIRALVGVRAGHHGRHHAHGSHLSVALVFSVVDLALAVGVWGGRRGGGVEQTCKVDCRGGSLHVSDGEGG